MRKYTDKFVREKLFLFHRLNNAACPFPGRYPLRLYFSAGGKAEYHGKFHSAVWRRFFNRSLVRDTAYVIYDKAGAVIWGTNMIHLNITRGELLYRYFGENWLGGQLLVKCTLQTIGPYRVYLTEGTRPAEWPSRFIHYINTHVPHIRTV